MVLKASQMFKLIAHIPGNDRETVEVSQAGLTENPLAPSPWDWCTSLSLGSKAIFQGLDVGWCQCHVKQQTPCLKQTVFKAQQKPAGRKLWMGKPRGRGADGDTGPKWELSPHRLVNTS